MKLRLSLNPDPRLAVSVARYLKLHIECSTAQDQRPQFLDRPLAVREGVIRESVTH